MLLCLTAKNAVLKGCKLQLFLKFGQGFAGKVVQMLFGGGFR